MLMLPSGWRDGGGSTGLTSAIRLLALFLVALLPACYHMRVVAEPIQPQSITVSRTPEEALRRVRTTLEKELHIRVIDEQRNGTVLIYTPHHFFTDTGFGQPAGGRKYLVQLQIEVETLNGQTVVTVVPRNFELRTSYAYSSEGVLHTLSKVYPYEEYPGMFDTVVMTREVKMVTGIIDRAMKE